VLPRFTPAGTRPRTSHSDRRHSCLKIGAAAVTAAAIAGIAVGASASPAFAEATRPSGPAAPARTPGPRGPAAGAPVLAAPAHGATAALALDDTALGKSALLANPATGTSHPSPLAVTQPAPAPAHKRPARPASSPAVSAPAAPDRGQQPNTSPSTDPSKPYEFYDSVEPQVIPAGAIVATYSTGAHPIPTSAVAGRKKVMWIDTLATDPSAAALDVEPGCATPSQVPGWVSSRLKSHPRQVAIVYMSLSEWSQVRADVASLPSWMRSRIRWWVADPTGVPHIVPGSQATQWYWGSSYDESMAAPNFQPDLVPGPGS
jgi:hypothetical protein